MTAMSISIVLAKAGSLFFMTFVSEDAAMLGGATMAAAGLMATPLVFAACFLGIWLGDMGLYALARYFGRPALIELLEPVTQPDTVGTDTAE